MKSWYYIENGERRGPLDTSEFQKLIDQGILTDASFVWTEGMSEWKRLDESPITSLPAKPSPPPIPPIPSPSSSDEPSPTSSADPAPAAESQKDTPPQYTPEASLSSQIPDYGNFLCWGFALILVPYLSPLVCIALVVLHIIELNAVRERVEKKKLKPSTYSNIHPVALGIFGIACCMISLLLYPLLMHFRNESKMFAPQPHAVWFTAAIIVASVFVTVFGMMFGFFNAVMTAVASYH